jgi:hypothetical protein
MSTSEEREILLSQLVDGELPVDQANQVLADVFDELTHVLGDSEAGTKLNAMLQLRRALDPWRRQEPPKTIVTLPSVTSANLPHSNWRLVNLATAALLGGILVAGGFYLGGRHNVTPQDEPIAGESMVIVTPEQRVEIARAFTLHESVAGPLSWYAADDSTIQVAQAQKGETLRPPIAIALRLTRDLSCPRSDSMPPKTYVIVCRSNDAAAIELPPAAMAAGLRLRLLSTETNGQVKLQYVLAADGSDRGPADAALAGHRHVGLGPTSLGQLALNYCLMSVDASAWVIGRDRVQ